MKLKEEIQNLGNKQNGITLIALVVTIVVLLILAAISINLILGDNGIFGKANDAKNRWTHAENAEKNGLNALSDKINEIVNNKSSGGTDKVSDLLDETEPSTVNRTVQDEYGNKVVIPAGFTVVSNGTDGVEYKYEKDAGGNPTGNPVVQDGIVIKDSEGNQFVWIPVGTIKNDAVENTINTTTITLGRYTFDTSGNPTPVQTNTVGGYSAEIKLGAYHYELQPNRTAESEPTIFGTISNGRSKNGKENAIAIDINEWIQQANTHGGYYMARYEASKNSTDNTKAASKSAAVWNNITQPNAAIAAQKMYPRVDEDTKVYSDLVNSYAWDTAIVFIQEYSGYSRETTKYSRENGLTFNSSLQNTGTNGDKVCNIYDMASNTMEWTTEASTATNYFCTSRGGNYYTSGYVQTSFRNSDITVGSYNYVSFRPVLCIK